MILNAAYSVVSMLLIIAIGFFAGGTEFFKKHDCGAVMTTYLKYIAIPVYMCYNAVSNFDSRADLIPLFQTLPYSLITVGASFAVGVALAKLLRIPPARHGTFVNACGFSNTVFLGFPVISSMFGDGIIPTGMVFYAANTIIFWTVGVYMLRVEGGKAGKFFTAANFKQMLAPPLIGFVAGLALVALGVRLPGFLMTTLQKVSATSSPIGMMFIGSVIRTAPLKQGGMLRDIAFLFVTRFLVFPAALLFLLMPMPVSTQTKQVFYILALMPAMTQLGVMSRDSGGDYPFASVWITVSTILGVGAIPLFTLILERYLV